MLAFILASETVLNRSVTLASTVPSENGSDVNRHVHTASGNSSRMVLGL